MARERIDMHRVQELVRLHRLGRGAREVARLLQMSPNTERRYREALRAQGLLAGPADAVPDLGELRAAIERAHPPHTGGPVSSLERWRERIGELHDKGVGPKAIHDRLRLEESDYTGSHSAVKRLVRGLAKAAGPSADEVAIVVETEPGQEAQVDFGYVGRLLDPERHVLRKAWVFVMTLCHSRLTFAKVVFDQKTTTWLALHVEAFRFFGGVPRTIAPDNLKAAVIRASFSHDTPTALNRSYRELARHFGFSVDPAPPYQPKKKGKVERAVKYVKRSYFAGRHGESMPDVQDGLARWLREVAEPRIHATTGRSPREHFEAVERAALLPIPAARFEAVQWHEAKVHPDCCIAFDRRLYSVPWRWVGRQVWVRATPGSVVVFGDDVRIATHSRHDRGRRSIDESHLPEGRRDLRHRSHAYWVKRAHSIHPDVAVYIEQVLASDDVLSQLRTAQAIVTHLEGFPPHRAQAACERAAFYGNTSYRGIKNILARALDFEPLPTVVSPQHGALETPRFARSITELLQLEQPPHESH